MSMDWQTTAAVFPGQGSQVVGMGADFAERYAVARDTFAQADEILGYSLSQYLLVRSGGCAESDEAYAAGSLRQQHGDLARAAGTNCLARNRPGWPGTASAN